MVLDSDCPILYLHFTDVLFNIIIPSATCTHTAFCNKTDFNRIDVRLDPLQQKFEDSHGLAESVYGVSYIHQRGRQAFYVIPIKYLAFWAFIAFKKLDIVEGIGYWTLSLKWSQFVAELT